MHVYSNGNGTMKCTYTLRSTRLGPRACIVTLQPTWYCYSRYQNRILHIFAFIFCSPPATAVCRHPYQNSRRLPVASRKNSRRSVVCNTTPTRRQVRGEAEWPEQSGKRRSHGRHTRTYTYRYFTTCVITRINNTYKRTHNQSGRLRRIFEFTCVCCKIGRQENAHPHA